MISIFRDLLGKGTSVNNNQVYFYRNYQGFSGGHLKMSHYFRHINEAHNFTSWIYFTEDSLLDSGNPWYPFEWNKLKNWDPLKADILFLGGMDWLGIPECYRVQSPVPVINLIQGKRHSHERTLLHSFLSHRAVRICVSKEVQQAIESTGMVNGPVFTIENGLDIDMIEKFSVPTSKRKYDICIAGLKNPAVANEISDCLADKARNTICLTQPLPRIQFLEILGQSNIAVLLPLHQEGYFLPFWEAAAAGCIPICPVHDGATSQFHHGINGYFPDYSKEEIIGSIQQCMQLSTEESRAIRKNAQELCSKRTLQEERKQFYRILENVKQLYIS